MGDVTIQEWPGGICTASGGTRTAVKLSRPWQKDIEVDPSTCPFEPEKFGDREVFARSEEAGGWLALGNLNTPLPYHRLIIPARCLPAQELRLLGGEEHISAAISLAYQMIYASDREVFELTVHIGALAGQNLPHLHWHLVEPIAVPERQAKPELTPRDVIFHDYGLVAIAGGHRAGQCFIFHDGVTDISDTSISPFLADLVALYARKFCSTEGLAPDYQIGLKFVRGLFSYGMLVPILNHWGTTEYFALLGTGPVILPWPHEETAKYLKGE